MVLYMEKLNWKFNFILIQKCFLCAWGVTASYACSDCDIDHCSFGSDPLQRCNQVFPSKEDAKYLYKPVAQTLPLLSCGCIIGDQILCEVSQMVWNTRKCWNCLTAILMLYKNSEALWNHNEIASVPRRGSDAKRKCVSVLVPRVGFQFSSSSSLYKSHKAMIYIVMYVKWKHVQRYVK